MQWKPITKTVGKLCDLTEEKQVALLVIVGRVAHDNFYADVHGGFSLNRRPKDNLTDLERATRSTFYLERPDIAMTGLPEMETDWVNAIDNLKTLREKWNGIAPGIEKGLFAKNGDTIRLCYNLFFVRAV